MKKDLNYIAKLEKAIRKKYGQEAIENPAKHWDEEKEKEYLLQLKDFVEKQRKKETAIEPENVNGVLITRKLLNKDNKINCPVCKKRTKTVRDDIYMNKFECCEQCYIE
ncbi:MAG: hypothetical protein CL554_19570, partial [Algoriphagus sp.]|uniref:hypothetical protein n=1 Tax=Algoriphagus sp. TaxID=1872435 RepID=UPI000C3585B6